MGENACHESRSAQGKFEGTCRIERCIRFRCVRNKFWSIFTREDYIVRFDLILAQNALLLGAQPKREPDTQDRHMRYSNQDNAYCCQPG